MSPAARGLWLVLAVTISYLVEISLARPLAVYGVVPRLGMAALVVACLSVGPNAGAVLGALLGVLEASYVAMFSGSYIVSRALTGFAIGYVDEWVFRRRLVVALAFGFLATLCADGLFFLFAPPPDAPLWWSISFRSSLYTCVASGVLYLVWQHVARKRQV